MNQHAGNLLFVAEDISPVITQALNRSGISSQIAANEQQILRQLRLKSPDIIIFSTDSSTIDTAVFAELASSLSPDSILLCCTKQGSALESVNTHLASQLPLVSIAFPENFIALISTFLSQAEKTVKVSVESHRQDYADLKQDQLAGFAVQQRLLPVAGQCLAGIEIDYKLMPSHFVSGDTLGVEQLKDGRVLFYLADVSGHGVAGSLITVLLNTLIERDIRNRSKQDIGDTGDIIERLNMQLLTHNIEQHLTILLGIYDESAGTLQYSNAAQFPAALVKTEQGVSSLNIGGLPLGVSETHYESFEVRLSGRFELVLFSDGVLEVLPEMTIKEKEEHLLSMVTDGDSRLDNLVAQLGLDDVTNVPDDIAIFTLAKTG
jgi:hypothetical protein